MRQADLAAQAALEAARSVPLPPPRPPHAASPPRSRPPRRCRRRRKRREPRSAPPAAPAAVHDHAAAAPPWHRRERAHGAGRRRPRVAPPAAEAAAPRARRRARRATPREVLAEADKLLGQGEVPDACARGEEAKRLGPRLPAVYKFLGKCYMRAGRAREANDNYKKYLELAPNASDALS